MKRRNSPDHVPVPRDDCARSIVPTLQAAARFLSFARIQSTADIPIAPGQRVTRPPGINLVPPLTRLSPVPYN